MPLFAGIMLLITKSTPCIKTIVWTSMQSRSSYHLPCYLYSLVSLCSMAAILSICLWQGKAETLNALHLMEWNSDFDDAFISVDKECESGNSIFAIIKRFACALCVQAKNVDHVSTALHVTIYAGLYYGRSSHQTRTAWNMFWWPVFKHAFMGSVCKQLYVYHYHQWEGEH